MSRYYIQDKDVPAGRAVKVFERNESSDELLAEYKGYYNGKTDTYTLYPTYNPFASRNGNIQKHTISARLVIYS